MKPVLVFNRRGRNRSPVAPPPGFVPRPQCRRAPGRDRFLHSTVARPGVADLLASSDARFCKPGSEARDDCRVLLQAKTNWEASPGLVFNDHDLPPRNSRGGSGLGQCSSLDADLAQTAPFGTEEMVVARHSMAHAGTSTIQGY